MKTKAGHLSYCTNIHPGEDWNTHFHQLKTYLPGIKDQVSPDDTMGIGLRISHQMSRDLLQGNVLNTFQSWLEENGFYVFTINGFPYGQFHGTVINDQVHTPDWTTIDRLSYTLRLFDILVRLLPDNVDSGGISTSPLSYRHWHSSEKDKNEATTAATHHIIQVAEYLEELYDRYGKSLHLDLEPEPDGLIENGEEFINWFEDVLLPEARNQLNAKNITPSQSDEIVRRHIRLCYDVCHMAVGFENQVELTKQLQEKNIPIGKIQLSSAIQLPPDSDPQVLKSFDEPQYLHQVVVKSSDETLTKFKDLPQALKAIRSTGDEWRVHFHVPVFTRHYEELSSTQDYIEEILAIHRLTPLTDHLEIETYTWNVLPEDLQLPIQDSIIREIQYIQSIL